jgi:PAS domain S-box-containing protein
MEKSVRVAGRFAQSTIDALSAHLCVLDETGVILATNGAWTRFAEANPPAARRAGIGDNYLQVCDSATGPDAAVAASFAEGVRAVIRGERVEFAMEYSCHSPSEQRWFVGRVTRFSDGGIVRVVVAHENISERKQAEITSNRLAAIVESSYDAIIGKDLNSIITSWNKGAERLFGYAAGEIVGTSTMRLIPADRQAEENQILGKLRRGEEVEQFETRRQTKDGGLIDVSVTESPIKDATGRIVGASKIARDLTVQKEREREIARSIRLSSGCRRETSYSGKSVGRSSSMVDSAWLGSDGTILTRTCLSP